MSFPSSPSNGQSATVNNISYTWDSTKGAWTRVTSTIATSSGAYANGAFIQANAAFTAANNASDSWVRDQANGAFLQANTPSYTANSAALYANAAFTAANNAIASGGAAAFLQANAAFTRANNSVNANTGGTISGDVIIAGNLTIQGTSFAANAGILTSNDTMFVLGIDNYTADVLDMGFASHYNNGTNAHAGLIRDSSSKEWYLFKEYTPEIGANNNININDASLQIDTLNANVKSTTITLRGVDLLGLVNNAYATANAAGNYANGAFLAANTPLTAGTYGGGSVIPVITVAANGRISSIANVTSSGGGSSSGYLANGVIYSNSTGYLSNTNNFQFLSSNSYMFVAGNVAASSVSSNNLIGTSANTTLQTGNYIWTFDYTGKAAFPSLLQFGDGTTQNTAYTGSAATYANGAFIQANAAFLVANAASVIKVFANSSQLTANTATGTGNILLGLANTAVTAATYGGASVVPVITIDQYGRITAASNVNSSGGGGSSSGYLANAAIYSNSTGYLSNTTSFQFLSSNNFLYVAGNVSAAVVSSNSVIGASANTNIQSGSYTWNFDNTGKTTLPNLLQFVDGTTQNTAYTGSAAVYANGAFIQANGAFAAANNAARVFANSSQLTANTSTGTGNILLGLANTAVTAATYGGGSVIPVITVDQYGRITAASNVNSSGGGSSSGYLNNSVIYANGTGYLSNTTSFQFLSSNSFMFVAGNVSANIVSSNNVIGTQANTNIVTGAYTWSFDNTGKTTLPNLLQFVDGTTQNTAYSSFSTRIYANSSQLTSNTATGTGNILLGLANTAVTPTTYGGAGGTLNITVDQYGRITAAANVTASGGGGVTLTNDTTTAANTYYPLMAYNTTSGTLSTANTSSTKFYYNPSTGTLNATIFNSISDETSKTDIQKIVNALSKISALGGYTYMLIDGNEPSAGLIAQEVQKVLPEAVKYNSDTGLLSLNYNAVLGLVVESINELEQRVTGLENGR